MPPKPQFTLSDQYAGVFAEICQKHGVTKCWLQWKFELAILNGISSPFTIDTNSDLHCNSLKDGLKKVIFTIDFDTNSFAVNYIKFTEFYDEADKKHFIVTQTSIDHVHEDTGCDLWLEVPASARYEDIDAVVNMWKVKICCDRWKEFLPACPVTQLERAHRIVSVENVEWLKNQLMKKEGVLMRKDEELAANSRDIESLMAQIGELSMRLSDARKELQQAQLGDLVVPSQRKILTPRSRAPKTPRTAPAKPFATSPGDEIIYEEPRTTLKRHHIEDPFVL